jgi:tetratricopeptide (TPR) repeat protein
MKINFFFTSLFLIFLFLTSNAQANTSSYFFEAKKLYEGNDFEKSKFLFEKDIVFNPKNERSYLYLAKIFNKNENKEEEEINLNNVLLLNPKNDEALYMLILIKIDQSDYKGVEKLIKQFTLVCDNFCSKENEIKNKFNKLTP